MPPDEGRTGIVTISKGESPVSADVIFVHGLEGHWTKSWTRPPAKKLSRRKLVNFLFRQPPDLDNDADWIFWPKDLLAADLAADDDVPGVRILCYGYDSDVQKMFRAPNQNNIRQHAENMLYDIQRERKDEGRPVVFVCHSLGGIITKEALRLSKAAEFKPTLQSLYKATYGVIFLGTPHRGSSQASLGVLVCNIATVALMKPNKRVLRDITKESTFLSVVADEFSNMVKQNKIKVHSFYEEKGMTGIQGFSGKVVDDYSSIIGDAAEGREGIDANHVEMCKFSGRNDNGYRKVLGVITSFVKEATTAPQRVIEPPAINNGPRMPPNAEPSTSILHGAKGTNARGTVFSLVGGNQYNTDPRSLVADHVQTTDVNQRNPASPRMDILSDATDTDISFGVFSIVGGNQYGTPSSPFRR